MDTRSSLSGRIALGSCRWARRQIQAAFLAGRLVILLISSSIDEDDDAVVQYIWKQVVLSWSISAWCRFWFSCLGRGPKQPKHGAAEQWRHHPSMYHWWHLKTETTLINRVSFWQVHALLHQVWGPSIKTNPKHMNWANTWQNKRIGECYLYKN